MANPLTPRAAGLDALCAWLSYLADERRASPRTIEAYGDAVRRYLLFLQTHRGEAVSLSDLGEVPLVMAVAGTICALGGLILAILASLISARQHSRRRAKP